MAFVTLSPSLSSRLSLAHGARLSPLRAHPRLLAHAAAPRRARVVRACADAPEAPAAEKEAEAAPEILVDENIGGFCSIDPRTGKRSEATLREKEALFLSAMQAYFRGENASLSNEEFDELKEELTWQGSNVTTLTRDEFMFLDAAKSYEQGEQRLSDEEFDELKDRLQEQGSVVAVQRGPRCSVSRQITFSDTVKDTRRLISLYLPAGVVMGLVWLSTSFELTPLRNVDPVLSLIIGSPIIYIGARVLTQIVVPNPTILVGDCPSCGRSTHVFFGKVLNLDGYDDIAEVKCDKCKAELSVEKETNRMILIKEGK